MLAIEVGESSHELGEQVRLWRSGDLLQVTS